jgi:hypothetical protein
MNATYEELTRLWEAQKRKEKEKLKIVKDFKWTDELVKDFARVYTGAKDYSLYIGLSIDKKLILFKKQNKEKGK